MDVNNIEDRLVAERREYINVSRLARKTKILLKTVDEVYELEVGTPEFGVVLVASDGRFINRDKRVVGGCIHPDTREVIPNVICEGCKVILRRPHRETIYTGPVIAARITGAHNEYSFDLWES